MTKYGVIYFKRGGVDSARQQKILTQRLNELGIIEVDPDWIEERYREDCIAHAGTDFYVALHGLKHIRIFRKLMTEEMISSNIVWRVTWKKPDWFKKHRRNRISRTLDDYVLSHWCDDL